MPQAIVLFCFVLGGGEWGGGWSWGWETGLLNYMVGRPDRMELAEYLKACSPAMTPVLIKLFQIQGTYPDSWTTGVITSIYKKGARNDPGQVIKGNNHLKCGGYFFIERG